MSAHSDQTRRQVKLLAYAGLIPFVGMAVLLWLVDSDLHALPLVPHVGDADPRRPRSRPVQIGSYVFIGAHSIVLKGSCIGDGAIVGAGSVIAGMVESHAVVVSPDAQAIGSRRAIKEQGVAP